MGDKWKMVERLRILDSGWRGCPCWDVVPHSVELVHPVGQYVCGCWCSPVFVVPVCVEIGVMYFK